MLTLGIDSGSTTTKGVLFDGEKVVKSLIIPTSATPRVSINEVYDQLYCDDVVYTVATGYGRELLDRADKKSPRSPAMHRALLSWIHLFALSWISAVRTAKPSCWITVSTW